MAIRAAVLAAWCLTGGAATAAEVTLGTLAISDAWARPTPPGITVGAVYLRITNRGAATDRLVEVSSPMAARGEIHETRTQAGAMKMRQVPALTLPPGATVSVSPGGTHFMLVGLRQSLAPGAVLPVTLTFQGAGSVTFEVPVQARD